MRVTLKIATSLDARIATCTGHSQWITGSDARAAVHRLRAEHDAVLVGSGTMLADDPKLTVRGFDVARQPDRVVLDTYLKTPGNAAIFDAPSGRSIIFAGRAAETVRETELKASGAEVERVAMSGSGLDVHDVLSRLSSKGLSSVFVEGGGVVAASFLKAGLIDKLEWFRAPMIIGGDGRPAFGSLGVEDLGAAFRLVRTGVREAGVDLWETYEKGE